MHVNKQGEGSMILFTIFVNINILKFLKHEKTQSIDEHSNHLDTSDGKGSFWICADSEGPDQPARTCRLVRAFDVRLLHLLTV